MIKADDYVDVSVRSYTLADLHQLAREFATEIYAGDVDNVVGQLNLNLFLQWLANRERGKQESNASNLLHFESERWNHG